ncbi:PAC2 family protein [Candidatus Woesearchaeota archaeon]|nr:PAC2 family protein [Candidatus Woesearchaeota archaeon]
MSEWTISKKNKFPKLNKPVLIEGLPGIGNVGKVAVDFIIEELRAVKLCEFFSYKLPHSVFVNEDSLVELPSISLYYKKMKKNDVLFLVGDVQPIDEESTYTFSEKVLDIFQEFRGSEIITLGGIGLPSVPKKPKIYCTGNSPDIIKKYAFDGVDSKLYGVVGPIIGVSGLLLGLAKRRSIKAAALLAETYGHPMYLGIKGAREIVRVLNTKLSLGINLKELDSEIKDIEEEVSRKSGISTSRKKSLRRLGRMGKDVSYIG